MNLYPKLIARQQEGRPLRIGMIGAGKFGSMFLAQMLKVPGVHLVGVVDLSPASAISNMKYVGWQEERFAAASFDDAAKHGTTHVSDDAQALIRSAMLVLFVGKAELALPSRTVFVRLVKAARAAKAKLDEARLAAFLNNEPPEFARLTRQAMAVVVIRQRTASREVIGSWRGWAC